jgi:hypothetical protein
MYTETDSMYRARSTTGAGARVKLHFADGSDVRLGENGTLRIEAVKIDGAAGTRNILLRLPAGLLRAAAAKLSKNTGSSFEIHTGVGYSAVRGTQWIVDAQAVETKVYVQEGRVAIGADFKTNQFPKLVEAGRWVSVTRRIGIGEVQDSPPGSLDGLVDQTEASLAPGTPDDEVKTVTETTSSALGGVPSITGVATDTVSDVANGVDGAVGNAATSAVDQATSAVSNVAGAAGNAAGGVVDQTTSTVSTTTDAVGSTVGGALSAVGGTVSGANKSSSPSGSGSSSGSASGSGSSGGGSASAGGGGSSGGGSGGSPGPSSSGSASGSGSSKSRGSLGRAVERALGGLL